MLAGRYRTTVAADSRLASEEFAGFAGRHVGDHTRGVVEAVHTAASGLGRGTRPSSPWPGCATGRASPRRSSARARPTQLAALLEAEDVELPEQIVHALDEVSVDHT